LERITRGAGRPSGASDVTTPIRSGLTYPVTFVFQRAGDLSMALPVEAPSDVPAPHAGEPRGGATGAPVTDANP
jgi:hypothetical protein